MASWSVRSSPHRAVWVRILAGDIVLCSWARHFTLTVPLSTQVYKWVLVNLMLGVTLRWTNIQERVNLLLVASSYSNRDKLRRDGHLAVQALLMANLDKITHRIPNSYRIVTKNGEYSQMPCYVA